MHPSGSGACRVLAASGGRERAQAVDEHGDDAPRVAAVPPVTDHPGLRERERQKGTDGARAGIAGAAGQQQFQRHWSSDVVGRADHNRMLPEQGVIGAFQQLHDAVWRAWPQQRQAHGQPPDIVGVKPVHILGREDAFDHGFGVDMPGQGKLHEDAIHPFVGVQLVDERQQPCLGDVVGQVVGK